jgi:hypothetical protein
MFLSLEKGKTGRAQCMRPSLEEVMIRLNVHLQRTLLASACALLVFGCAQTPTPSPTAVPDSSIKPTGPAVAAPAPVAPPAVAAAPAPAPMPVAPPVVSSGPNPSMIATTAALTPSGKTRYSCEVGSSKSTIALPEGTDRICSRFPAMGPCQYERDACRAKGGRVIRFDGVEITPGVEAEYDKQVQRFKLNAG